MKMEIATLACKARTAARLWKEDVKDVEKWFILDKLEILEMTLRTLKDLQADGEEMHSRAVEERGGWNTRYQGRECDLAEIELSFACGELRRAIADVEKELAKVKRKAKKFGIA